jgi:hypothetical protein
MLALTHSDSDSLHRLLLHWCWQMLPPPGAGRRRRRRRRRRRIYSYSMIL